MYRFIMIYMYTVYHNVSMSIRLAIIVISVETVIIMDCQSIGTIGIIPEIEIGIHPFAI